MNKSSGQPLSHQFRYFSNIVHHKRPHARTALYNTEKIGEIPAPVSYQPSERKTT